MRLVFESVDSVDCPPTMGVDIIQSTEGLNRTKSRRRDDSFPPYLPTDLGHWSPALGLRLTSLLPWLSGLQTWTGIIPLAFLGLQLATVGHETSQPS